MEQEKKEEREGGGSLSSLPLEGRVYGEGLGYGHILQGKKKASGMAAAWCPITEAWLGRKGSWPEGAGH